MNFEITPTPDPFLFESFVQGIIEMEGVDTGVERNENEDGNTFFIITTTLIARDATFAQSYVKLHEIHLLLKDAADRSGGLSIRPSHLFNDSQNPEITEELERFGDIEITPLNLTFFGKDIVTYCMVLNFTCSFLS